jgi:hypothetical protein
MFFSSLGVRFPWLLVAGLCCLSPSGDALGESSRPDGGVRGWTGDEGVDERLAGIV